MIKFTTEDKSIHENSEITQKLTKGHVLIPPPPPKKPRCGTALANSKDLDALRVEFFEYELRELLENSKRVVEQCDEVISKCTDKDEYLKNDNKVAKMIHMRLVERYTKLLNWQSALG